MRRCKIHQEAFAFLHGHSQAISHFLSWFSYWEKVEHKYPGKKNVDLVKVKSEILVARNSEVLKAI